MQLVASLTPSTRKPRRPLTAYLTFFRIACKRISKDDEDEIGRPLTQKEIKCVIREHNNSSGRPRYAPKCREIGFVELSKIIALQWQHLDSESREMLEEYIIQEREQYMSQLIAWTIPNGETDVFPGDNTMEDINYLQRAGMAWNHFSAASDS